MIALPIRNLISPTYIYIHTQVRAGYPGTDEGLGGGEGTWSITTIYIPDLIAIQLREVLEDLLHGSDEDTVVKSQYQKQNRSMILDMVRYPYPLPPLLTREVCDIDFFERPGHDGSMENVSI